MIRLLLQKQSDQGLCCLPRPFEETAIVRNFRTFTVFKVKHNLLYCKKFFCSKSCLNFIYGQLLWVCQLCLCLVTLLKQKHFLAPSVFGAAVRAKSVNSLHTG